MSRWRAAAAAAQICLALCFTLAGRANSAPVVWTGPSITFSKPPGGDPLLPSNQDQLTNHVAFTRGSFQGLLNADVDCDTSGCTYQDDSPSGTQWATSLQNPGASITAANWAALTFVDWETAFGGQSNLQGNIVTLPAVVHLLTDDVYLNISFSEWGTHGSGNFTYQRSTPVPEPSAIALFATGALALAALMMRHHDGRAGYCQATCKIPPYQR
jgi:hypothetical protein